MSNTQEFKDSNSGIWEKIGELEEKMDANTRMTQRVVDNTLDLIAAFEALKGAFKVLEFLGKTARPILWIAGVPTAVYAAWLGIKAWLKL